MLLTAKYLSTREEKFRTFKRLSNFLFIIKSLTIHNDVFGDFPKICNHLPIKMRFCIHR